MLTHDQRAAAEATIAAELRKLVPDSTDLNVIIRNQTTVTDPDTDEQIELPPIVSVTVRLPTVGIGSYIPEQLLNDPDILPAFTREGIGAPVAHEFRQLADRIDTGDSNSWPHATPGATVTDDYLQAVGWHRDDAERRWIYQPTQAGN